MELKLSDELVKKLYAFAGAAQTQLMQLEMLRRPYLEICQLFNEVKKELSHATTDSPPQTAVTGPEHPTNRQGYLGQDPATAQVPAEEIKA